MPSPAVITVVVPGELDELLADCDDAAFEVHIRPAKPQRLATTDTRGGQGLEQRAERIGCQVIEQPAQLAGFEGLHPRPLPRLDPGERGWVHHDQTLAYRVGERGAQGGAVALLRRGLHIEVIEGGLDVGSPDRADVNAAESGNPHVVDVMPVIRAVGRPEILLALDPLAEVLADGHPPLRVDATDDLAACLFYRSERFPLGGIPGPAEDATLAVLARL